MGLMKGLSNLNAAVRERKGGVALFWSRVVINFARSITALVLISFMALTLEEKKDLRSEARLQLITGPSSLPDMLRILGPKTTNVKGQEISTLYGFERDFLIVGLVVGCIQVLTHIIYLLPILESWKFWPWEIVLFALYCILLGVLGYHFKFAAPSVPNVAQYRMVQANIVISVLLIMTAIMIITYGGLDVLERRKRRLEGSAAGEPIKGLDEEAQQQAGEDRSSSLEYPASQVSKAPGEVETVRQPDQGPVESPQTVPARAASIRSGSTAVSAFVSKPPRPSQNPEARMENGARVESHELQTLERTAIHAPRQPLNTTNQSAYTRALCEASNADLPPPGLHPRRRDPNASSSSPSSRSPAGSLYNNPANSGFLARNNTRHEMQRAGSSEGDSVRSGHGRRPDPVQPRKPATPGVERATMPPRTHLPATPRPVAVRSHGNLRDGDRPDAAFARPSRQLRAPPPAIVIAPQRRWGAPPESSYMGVRH